MRHKLQIFKCPPGVARNLLSNRRNSKFSRWKFSDRNQNFQLLSISAYILLVPAQFHLLSRRIPTWNVRMGGDVSIFMSEKYSTLRVANKPNVCRTCYVQGRSATTICMLKIMTSGFSTIVNILPIYFMLQEVL
jgi:hypothetical protein